MHMHCTTSCSYYCINDAHALYHKLFILLYQWSTCIIPQAVHITVLMMHMHYTTSCLYYCINDAHALYHKLFILLFQWCTCIIPQAVYITVSMMHMHYTTSCLYYYINDAHALYHNLFILLYQWCIATQTPRSRPYFYWKSCLCFRLLVHLLQNMLYFLRYPSAPYFCAPCCMYFGLHLL